MRHLPASRRYDVFLVLLTSPSAIIVLVALLANHNRFGDSARAGRAQWALLLAGLLWGCFSLLAHRKALKDMRPHHRPYHRTILYTTASVSLSFIVGTLLVDRLLGLLGFPLFVDGGIIFPVRSEAIYETSEFRFTARINSLGIRDREIAPKTDSLRVVAIGDSFTYGWGVELEESWPKVLERRLRHEGYDIEVINVGGPGAGPADYANVAKRAVPILRPDLVIVAVLQGDDLAASARVRGTAHANGSATSLGGSSFWRRYYGVVLPNIARLTERRMSFGPLSEHTISIREHWRKMAANCYQGLDAQSKRRFDRIDDEIKKAFMAGDLNPATVTYALANPHFWLEAIDRDRPESKRLIANMSQVLGCIKTTCGRLGATVVTCSVPHGVYVSQRQWLRRRSFGYRVDPLLLTTRDADEVIRIACEQAAIPFFNVTDSFRQHAHQTPLFFPLDGHFNADGHRLFAESIADKLPLRELLQEHRGVRH